VYCHALGYDPLSGHVFVFLNRRRNQVKLILWTRSGFTIVHAHSGSACAPALAHAMARRIMRSI
jgi:hypothetical protein